MAISEISLLDTRVTCADDCMAVNPTNSDVNSAALDTFAQLKHEVGTSDSLKIKGAVIRIFGYHSCPFVRKVLLTLSHKGLLGQNPYDIKVVLQETLPVVGLKHLGLPIPPDFDKASPFGAIPAMQVTDVDGNEFMVADSAVIADYLERIVPGNSIYPTNPQQAGFAQWLQQYSLETLGDSFNHHVYAAVHIRPKFFGAPVDKAAVDHAVETELPPIFNYLEGLLKKSGEKGWNFLADSKISIADFSIGGQLVNLRLCGYTVDNNRWPALAKYLDGLFQTPEFQALKQFSPPGELSFLDEKISS